MNFLQSQQHLFTKKTQIDSNSDSSLTYTYTYDQTLYETVRFTMISDTHSSHDKLPSLPPCDVLLVLGDYTNFQIPHQVLSFNKYLNSQKHIPIKIIVPGNHEWNPDCLYFGLNHTSHILLNEELVIKNGRIKIFGVRFKPWYMNFIPFTLGDKFAQKNFQFIPKGIDILLSHQPPKNCGFDVYRGNEGLMKQIEIVKPKVVVFGHEHENNGIYYNEELGINFINASSISLMFGRGKPRKPLMFDYLIPKLDLSKKDVLYQSNMEN